MELDKMTFQQFAEKVFDWGCHCDAANGFYCGHREIYAELLRRLESAGADAKLQDRVRDLATKLEVTATLLREEFCKPTNGIAASPANNIPQQNWDELAFHGQTADPSPPAAGSGQPDNSVQERSIHSTMDIYSLTGAKVKFAHPKNGYQHDQDQCAKYLAPGGIYTVERTEVHSSSTGVWLQEFPDQCFNSVMFDSAEPSGGSGQETPVSLVGLLNNLRVIGDELRMNLHDAAVLSPEHFHAEGVKQLIKKWDAAAREVVIKVVMRSATEPATPQGDYNK